jgi:sec-independent protein translocase protein TatB
MLSIPHMIVVFIIVLVIFGPQKLPELARGLGKLMAEFRKASTDFKSAFEEEMRDLERQAREVERKKAALLASSSAAGQPQPATLATPSGAETQAPGTELAPSGTDTRVTEASVITPVPVPEAVARSSEAVNGDSQPAHATEAKQEDPAVNNSLNPAHDQQQPA